MNHEFLSQMVKSLVEHDWTNTENIHTIFSENFDNNILYYSTITNIVYNASKDMVGYINVSGNILFSS